MPLHSSAKQLNRIQVECSVNVKALNVCTNTVLGQNIRSVYISCDDAFELTEAKRIKLSPDLQKYITHSL